MARYKHINTSPRFIAVDLQKQLLPGTIEHALNYLLDHQIDLTGLDARFCNDATGAAAYPPAMLLKIILFAYSQGIISSRNIERACREHITFIALSGDTAPHFTTIANFISTLGEEIAHIFSQVLFICDQHPPRSLLANATEDQDTTGVVLPRQSNSGELHRQDEAAYRQPRRPGTLWQTLRHGGAGIW